MVFQEKDLKKGEGATVDVYVFFYAEDDNDPIAQIDIKLTSDGVGFGKTRYNTIEVNSKFWNNYAKWNAHFSNQAWYFAGDCFEAFDDFLMVNDFDKFHRK